MTAPERGEAGLARIDQIGEECQTPEEFSSRVIENKEINKFVDWMAINYNAGVVKYHDLLDKHSKRLEGTPDSEELPLDP